MNAETNDAGYYDLGGTIRAEHPDKTLEKLNKLLPLLGITRVANITGLDNVGIPVATCIRPNAKHLSVAQGKGLTPVLAEVSAIMEATEAFHAENFSKPELKGTFDHLSKSFQLVDPNLFNKTKFSIRNLSNLEIGWCKALDLVSKETIYIPHVLGCLDSTQGHIEYNYLSVSTNGLAAGNTQEEALCHALYELIERDALFHWRKLSAQQRKACLLNNDSIQEEINRTVINKFKQAKLFIKIWEITAALGVPTFHCALYDDNLFRSLGLFTGTGTHFSKAIALTRALTEAAQARLTLISGNRDDIFPDYYRKQQLLNNTISEHFMSDGNRHFEECATIQYKLSFTENINQLITLLKQQGHSAIFIVDHTKPDINIPVMQAFVPGLQFNGTRM